MGIRKLSAADQTAAHLRGWLVAHHADKIPGVDRLAKELGVSRDTVREALLKLEEDGVIRPGGNGRARTIAVHPEATAGTQSLRVIILTDTRMEYLASHLATHVLSLQKHLTEAGHGCQLANRVLADFDGNTARLERFVEANPADVWVVMAAPEHVLRWFLQQPFVTIAWGGWHRNLPMPGSGTSLLPAIRAATQHLLSLGHRRISFLCMPMLRRPVISASGRAFLEELAAGGVSVDQGYHIPDFPSTPEGLHAALEQLFRVTPPTALLITAHTYHLAVLTFLQSRGLRVPEDVSIIPGYMDPKLDWMLPKQAHFRLYLEKITRRISRWVDGYARGRQPQGCVTFDAEYVPGETVVTPPQA